MEARGNALAVDARVHLLLEVCAVLALTLLYASTARADTFTVTNTSNSGAGSLREAINKANASAGSDEIVFADGVGGTITLSSTLPTITDPAGLTIDGGGDVTVSGNDVVRVFRVGRGAKLSLSKLTVSDGVDSSFGGGVFNEGGTVEVTGSTFSGNFAGDSGGGISNSGTLSVTDTTFSGGESVIGDGIYNEGGTATLRSTIVANNAGGNCGGSLTDGGYNIDDDGTCGFTTATGSLPDTDPLLDPEGLQDNGGPTETIALQSDSPAVDLVGQEACPPPATDQRGVERPQGEACDSGAYELVQGPQTKADCKKGGYEEFDFENQGQCIAFVNRATEKETSR